MLVSRDYITAAFHFLGQFVWFGFRDMMIWLFLGAGDRIRGEFSGVLVWALNWGLLFVM